MPSVWTRSYFISTARNVLSGTIARYIVSGRFKTSHSWALQNQPPLLGVSDTHVDCNGLGFVFLVPVLVWPSLAA